MSDLLNSASLVMIPSGYKEDVVYSQIPTDGSGDLSFTRASNGTRVNSAGLVEVAPWNLLEYSEDFSNGAWYQNNTTINTNVATAPNGTMTADRLTATANFGSILQATTQIVQIYTESIWVKSESGTVNGSIFGISSAATRTDFVATTTWQRITNTATSLGGTRFVEIRLDTNGTSILIWGAQLNIGSTAKPYFPTTDRLNVPRLTYQNGGGGCPSLLLEKQSTNIAPYSEDFSNAVWLLNGASVSTNTTISPDGTQNADTVNFSSGGPIEQLIYYAAANQTHTISCWVKVASGTCQFRLKCTHAGVVDYFSPYYTATTTWQRFDFSQAFGSGGVGFYAGIDGNGNTLNLWGFQLEPNTSYATSYIPTTSSSATRVADACYKTGISSLIGQTSGALFVEFNSSFLESYTQRIFTLSDGTTSNVIGFQLTGANQLVFYVEYGGSNQVAITKSAPAITLGSNVKIAAAYANNDFVFYVNGTQIGTDTSGSVPATSQLRFSEGNATTFYLGLIKQVCLFQTRLTNAELASLTTI